MGLLAFNPHKKFWLDVRNGVKNRFDWGKIIKR
jgi:hypothetical protein